MNMIKLSLYDVANLFYFTVTGLLMLVHLATSQSHNRAFFNSSISSSLTLPSTVIQPRQRLQFSFRTCHAGQLIHQQSADGSDSILYEVTDAGALSLTFSHGGTMDTVSMTSDSNLINNQWYSVDSQFVTGELTVNVEQGPVLVESILVSNSSLRTYIWDLDLSGGSGVQVGVQFTGCILEGIGLPISDPDTVNNNVEWDVCPLEDLDYTGCGKYLCQHFFLFIQT